VPNPSFT